MSENTDPQQPPTWEPSGHGQADYQQPPFASPYPPPPQYAPGPGYGLQPVPPTYAGDTSIASMAHWLAIVVGLWAPLIIMFTTGERDRFVREHAVEALNFNLTMLIAYLVLIPIAFLTLVGFVGFVILPIVMIVFQIMAAMAASRGETYRYPVNIRMVH
jgi:uncharacterized Tic20 family protein